MRDLNESLTLNKENLLQKINDIEIELKNECESKAILQKQFSDVETEKQQLVENINDFSVKINQNEMKINQIQQDIKVNIYILKFIVFPEELSIKESKLNPFFVHLEQFLKQELKNFVQM